MIKRVHNTNLYLTLESNITFNRMASVAGSAYVPNLDCLTELFSISSNFVSCVDYHISADKTGVDRAIRGTNGLVGLWYLMHLGVTFHWIFWRRLPSSPRRLPCRGSWQCIVMGDRQSLEIDASSFLNPLSKLVDTLHHFNKRQYVLPQSKFAILQFMIFLKSNVQTAQHKLLTTPIWYEKKNRHARTTNILYINTIVRIGHAMLLA